MALKPNYNQQRAERNRAKQEKRDRKQRESQERRATKLGSDDKDAVTGSVAMDDVMRDRSE